MQAPTQELAYKKGVTLVVVFLGQLVHWLVSGPVHVKHTLLHFIQILSPQDYTMLRDL